MSRPGKRLIGLVNPRMPDGTLKDPAQVAKELQAQVDADRAKRKEASPMTKPDEDRSKRFKWTPEDVK